MRERKPVRALSCKAARQKNCGGEGLGYKAINVKQNTNVIIVDEVGHKTGKRLRGFKK